MFFDSCRLWQLITFQKRWLIIFFIYKQLYHYKIVYSDINSLRVRCLRSSQLIWILFSSFDWVCTHFWLFGIISSKNHMKLFTYFNDEAVFRINRTIVNNWSLICHLWSRTWMFVYFFLLFLTYSWPNLSIYVFNNLANVDEAYLFETFLFSKSWQNNKSWNAIIIIF